MMVDRRWSARHVYPVDVRIRCDGRVLVDARTVDIGLEGMRFATRTCLSQDIELIRVSFSLYDGVDRRHDLRAIIVHRTQDTYGLKFLDYDHGLFQWTEEVLEVNACVPCAG